MKRDDGLYWDGCGLAGLSGPLWNLAKDLDESFVQLAHDFGAAEFQFGPLITADDLRRIDYFSAFPHLVMFPAAVHADPDSVRAFSATNGADTTGPLRIDQIGEVSCVLTPAACYPVYIALSGASLSQEKHATVKSTCFRNETEVQALVRQRAFHMREIIHIGNRQSVEAFLEAARPALQRLAQRWKIAASFQPAADPFFDPGRSPKYLHARLFPSKHELVSDGVAIASLNNHRNFFGEAFGIAFNGEAAHTACAAFGIERWVHAAAKAGA